MVNEYIPMSKWGKDHWSMLAYMETVMVEQGGFQVGFDARVRQNRRHFRVMQEECPKPKRASHGRIGMPMEREHGTRLNDGTAVEGHDDWMCVQDMAEAGLLDVEDAGDIQPKRYLHLTLRGQQLSAELRAHKMNGGSFGNFVPSELR